MIRITLDDATRKQLNALRRADPPARVRDRLEMVALSDAGWSPPRIAEHLGYCGHTVRAALRGFQDRGTAALTPGRSGLATRLADLRLLVCWAGLFRIRGGSNQVPFAGQVCAALKARGIRGSWSLSSTGRCAQHSIR